MTVEGAAVRGGSLSGRLLQPLRNSQFALLYVGQTVSRMGDSAYQTVLAWTVYAISGSTADTGYVLMAFNIPQLVLLLAGGIIGDRWSRRGVVVISDSLSALAVGAVALLAFLGRLTVLELGVLSAVFGAVSAFFLPAYQGMVPDIVPAEELQTANALEGMSFSATAIVGPTFGAALYSVGRAGAAFAFDALSFVVAALTAVGLHVPSRPPAEQNVWSDIRAGFGYVRRTTWLWVSTSVATVANAIGLAPGFVLLPVVIKHLHLGVGYVGLTFAISGVASIVGNLVIGHVHIPRRGVVLYVLWIVLALNTMLLGLAHWYWMVALSGVAFGLGISSMAIWQSLVQELVPPEYLSRVFSLDMLGSFAMMPVGFAGAGVLAAAFGPAPVLIVGSGVAITLPALGLLTPAIRGLR